MMCMVCGSGRVCYMVRDTVTHSRHIELIRAWMLVLQWGQWLELANGPNVATSIETDVFCGC